MGYRVDRRVDSDPICQISNIAPTALRGCSLAKDEVRVV